MSKVPEWIVQHPAGKVKLAIADIDGVLRGKYVSIEKFEGVAENGFGFCDVVFGWDMNDAAYDNSVFTGWHTGYPDTLVQLDMATIRKIPWENGVPFVLGDCAIQENGAHFICPRQLLKKITAECYSSGFAPFFSQEFEWFNFEETPQTIEEKNFTNLKPLTPGMFGYSLLRSSYRNDFMEALFSQLAQFDVPLEGLHTETGPGVYEAAIAYAEIMDAADRAVLFKTAVKEIASKLGITATFMAKISESLPGCSGHVHQSLWNADKTINLFYDEQEPDHMSGLMRSYIAGQLKCLPEILPMVAPTVNSYKRLVEGAWAPTTLTWAVDNRTVALRSLPAGKKSCRLETRVVGSDTNPYLAMAACLAAGLYGIKNKLSLGQPPTKGSGYSEKQYGVLPANLGEATSIMKKSALAKELFGENFVAHFTATREWEWKQYAKAVTDWEKRRYFEII
ncbi:glutamine synthetase [Pollutibacter soli]|uniref:glutamine synthetase family protein n=1 Tax=Pollutibacter soli TaxID=3034157 RepID=UPI003013E38C